MKKVFVVVEGGPYKMCLDVGSVYKIMSLGEYTLPLLLFFFLESFLG